MAVAIDTSFLARVVIPYSQAGLDDLTGGRRRFQVHKISAYATIPSPDSEIWKKLSSALQGLGKFDISLAKVEALDWQADPDDDLSDAAVFHHLHQQAATAPLVTSATSQSDHGNAATTITGSALSASITVSTQGRLLSSFHRYSFRQSCLGHRKCYNSCGEELVRRSNWRSHLPSDVCIEDPTIFRARHIPINNLFNAIVWAGPRRDNQLVFWQLQLDIVDLFSRRTPPTSHVRRRPRTAFNQFLQVSDSPVVEDTSRGNPLPHARRYNGVRHRRDRRTWVAEMKPPKHKTKQDFGNFKSEAEAARAVDAALHHYGRPDLLNFPDTSLQFLSKRPPALPGLDERAKVKFVREEAKLLLAATAATSPPHSTHTNSLQILELSASRPSGGFLPLRDFSSQFSCRSCCMRSDCADAAISQPQPWVDLDSICDISTTGVRTNLETLNSMQNAEKGWDWAEDSSTLAEPPNVVNLIAYQNQSMWLDSLIRSPPALTSSRSPSPSHFEEGIANALLEQQNI